MFSFFNGEPHPLSANPTKWPNTLKQFVGKLPNYCLGVFDYFMKLSLKVLMCTDVKFALYALLATYAISGDYIFTLILNIYIYIYIYTYIYIYNIIYMVIIKHWKYFMGKFSKKKNRIISLS